MSNLIWLSEAHMRQIEPHFPLSHGVPRVDVN
jgi:putative transposase